MAIGKQRMDVEAKRATVLHHAGANELSSNAHRVDYLLPCRPALPHKTTERDDRSRMDSDDIDRSGHSAAVGPRTSANCLIWACGRTALRLGSVRLRWLRRRSTASYALPVEGMGR